MSFPPPISICDKRREVIAKNLSGIVGIVIVFFFVREIICWYNKSSCILNELRAYNRKIDSLISSTK